MKTTNEALIQEFYTSFAKGDAKGMINCYHPDIIFTDPAFGTLKGEKAKSMWQMLLSRNKEGLHISFGDVKATENTGSASWQAKYTYGPKKRKVVNNVTATFVFLDGKIVEHTDTFNLWKWSKQALGLSGFFIGWTPFLKKKIQANTNKLLHSFISSSKNKA